MGKSESLLDGYLAQQWFFSLIGKSTSERFSKICEIVKIRSYEQVKLDIAMHSQKINVMRQEYSKKLKNIKAKTKEIKKKYQKVKNKKILKRGANYVR